MTFEVWCQRVQDVLERVGSRDARYLRHTEVGNRYSNDGSTEERVFVGCQEEHAG